MTQSREVCKESAIMNGIEQVFAYSENMIYGSGYFFQDNEEILRAKRGCGYWLWKPYIINHVMRDDHCQDGDILIYCDAGVKIIENVNRIIEVMDQDIFLFSNGHQHVHWCKADVLEAICPLLFQSAQMLSPEGVTPKMLFNPLTDSYQQVQASVIFFKVNQNTRNFVKEWLLWCQMPGFIDDSPSKLPNHPEFAQHRYDQAILTCLAIKYGYKLHWWADRLWYESQRHRWPDDHYTAMFEHHRKRNKGAITDPEGPTW
jgi:hypothetical protein